MKHGSVNYYMLKKYVRNLYTNIYLNAAKELGIDFTVIDKESSLCQLNFHKTSILLFKSALGVNSYASSKIASDKDVSALLLRQITPIGPKYVTFYVNVEKPRAIAKHIYQLAQKNDIVIKAPSLSSGKGIYIKPRTLPTIQRAVNELRLRHKTTKILVEPHFTATQEYRILIYRGRILDVLLRKPAFVTGDGRQTVQQLIEQKNRFRKLHEFSLIRYDRALLTKQRRTLRSIPTEGAEVTLQSACNLALGGEVERRPLSSLHPLYRQIMQQLYQKSFLSFIGLDLMTNNPSAKPTSTNAFINEFNSCPSTDVSYFADINSNDHLFGVKKILLAVKKDLA